MGDGMAVGQCGGLSFSCWLSIIAQTPKPSGLEFKALDTQRGWPSPPGLALGQEPETEEGGEGQLCCPQCSSPAALLAAQNPAG